MKNEHIRIDWHSCLAVFVVCDETLQTLSLLFYSGKCWPVLFTDCIQPTLLGVVLTQLVIKVVDLFGSFANVTEEFSKYSLIVIHSANEQMSLYVDYECSGVIETAAYLGLLTFYPLYNRQEKVFYALLERCGFLQAMLSDYSLLWHLFISAAAMLISSLTRFWVDCSSMDL